MEVTGIGEYVNGFVALNYFSKKIREPTRENRRQRHPPRPLRQGRGVNKVIGA